MTTTERDTATLLVVVERLEDLRTDLGAIRMQLTAQAVTFVPRGEWVQRNESVDERFRALGRELGDLRTEVRSRRLPWTNVLSAVAAGVALLVSLGVIGT